MEVPAVERPSLLGRARNYLRSLVAMEGASGSQQDAVPRLHNYDCEEDAPPLEVQQQMLMQHQPIAPPPAASRFVIDEPDHLLCPISFTLLYDPVMLVSGHTYERESILRFWATRPLANPIGSGNAPPLRSAQMIINYGMRSMVADWLVKQPEGYVPSGWENPRMDGRRLRRASQEELDALAKSVEEAAAATAAEAEKERQRVIAEDEAEAEAMLQFAAERVRIFGQLPPDCECIDEYLGTYERLPGRLVNGRHVYAQVRVFEAKDDTGSGSGSESGSGSGSDGESPPRDAPRDAPGGTSEHGGGSAREGGTLPKLGDQREVELGKAAQTKEAVAAAAAALVAAAFDDPNFGSGGAGFDDPNAGDLAEPGPAAGPTHRAGAGAGAGASDDAGSSGAASLAQEAGPTRASARRMLWYANATRFWHFGPAAYVGQPCGHGACYGSGADKALPEHLPIGHWMVCKPDSAWVQATGLQCRDARAELSDAYEDANGIAARNAYACMRGQLDLHEAMRIGEGDLLLL
jgi:hypothetical protein